MENNNAIKALIQNQGPLDLARFMNEALMNPEFGYYQKQTVFGSEGDFTTAPEISQIFGELVGVWCAAVWLTHYYGQKVCLVELGPGRATLMQDVLRGTAHIKDFHQHIEIHLVETSAQLRQQQQQALADFPGTIEWHHDVATLPKKTSLIIANEFFDALPIHQYQKRDNKWFETHVNVIDDALAFTLNPANISTLLETEHGACPEGGFVEISVASQNVMNAISTHIGIHGGAAIIIDYGYAKKNYANTFQAVLNHQYHHPLEKIGMADLTAHVDFESLHQIATTSGLNVSPITGQGEFLQKMGIALRVEALLKRATDSQKELIISAAKRLTSDDEMGTLFKTLMLTHKQITNPIDTV
jgi:NADH dehydrogenase [ubiquinone] 1 alpha subcomplex assembly factor 7